MSRKNIVAFAAAVLFAAATGASVLNSLTTTAIGFDHTYRTSNNKPYYLKGRILDGCFDHSPECVLLAW